MKSSKNKKLFMGICLLIISMLIGGCSLAVPEAESNGDDRLIGAFITSEYLDLFDIDAYLNDHVNELINSKELIAADTSEYNQRLYASIDQKNSTDPFDWEISFPNVTGISFFSPYWSSEDSNGYWGNVCDNGICDSNISINSSDTGNETTLTGTIYILPEKTDEIIAYYVNPVYQTADGDIYVQPGSGFSTSGDCSEGEKISTTLSDQIDTMENGKTMSVKSSVAINIAVMYKPLKITLYQMDSDHQIIKSESYTPGKLPETLRAETGTEYILAETEKEALTGETFISREIYNYTEDEENIIKTFYVQDSNILSRQDTEIEWPHPN